MYLPSFKAEKKSLELRGGGQALIYEATSYRDTRGMQWVVGQDMVAVLAPRGGGRFERESMSGWLLGYQGNQLKGCPSWPL